MAVEKGVPPTTVRFTEGQLKLIEEARREDESLSSFIRTVVMDAATRRIVEDAR